MNIHQADSEPDICRPVPFDGTFTRYFTHHAIEAFHIDGHTPGFTFYIFEESLFICDYLGNEEECCNF